MFLQRAVQSLWLWCIRDESSREWSGIRTELMGQVLADDFLHYSVIRSRVKDLETR